MLQRKGLRNVPAWQTPTYHLQIYKLGEILGTCIQLLEGGNFVNRERDHSNNRSGMFSTVMAACCAVFCHSFWFILATSSMELIVFYQIFQSFALPNNLSLFSYNTCEIKHVQRTRKNVQFPHHPKPGIQSGIPYLSDCAHINGCLVRNAPRDLCPVTLEFPTSYCENLNRNRYAIYFRESETAG